MSNSKKPAKPVTILMHLPKCHAQAVFIMLRLFSSCADCPCHP